MEKYKVVFDQEGRNIFREACSERHKPLGKGVSGSVYLASYKGGTYAVKKMQLPLKKMDWRERYAKREVRILKILQEFENDSSKKNLVKIYDSWQDERLIYIVMEFCNQGNLVDYIKLNGDGEERLSEEKAFHIFTELVNGYYLLYRHKIVHRDLKPENILIRGGVSKLADLGMAKQTGTETATMQAMMVGNELFRPPFVDRSDEWTNDTEVWSFGLLVLGMLLGKHFMPTIMQNMRILNETGIADTNILKNLQIQPRTKKLLERIIHTDEKKRMKWPELFDLILGANPNFLKDELIDVILEQYDAECSGQITTLGIGKNRLTSAKKSKAQNRLKSEFDLKVKYTTNYLRQFIDKIKDLNYQHRKVFQGKIYKYENMVLTLSLIMLNIIRSLLLNLSDPELAKEIPAQNLQKLQQFFKMIEDKQIALRKDYVMFIQKYYEENKVVPDKDDLRKYQELTSSILQLNSVNDLNIKTPYLVEVINELFKYLDSISDEWKNLNQDFFKFIDDLFFFSTPIDEVIDLLLDKKQDVEHYFNQRSILSNEDFKNEVFEEIKERIS